MDMTRRLVRGGIYSVSGLWTRNPKSLFQRRRVAVEEDTGHETSIVNLEEDISALCLWATPSANVAMEKVQDGWTDCQFQWTLAHILLCVCTVLSAFFQKEDSLSLKAGNTVNMTLCIVCTKLWKMWRIYQWRVIKAMNASWHPECFRCFCCAKILADEGFVKNQGRALCKDCNAMEKAKGLGKYVCLKCHSIIDGGHLKWKGEPYHPYHFNCHSCGIELKEDAREKDAELYCLRCHDKMETIFIFRHYEKKGLAYYEIHYHQLFGNICFVCNNIINGDVFSAFNKAWCVNHFACSICDKKMSQKTKFFEFDQKPVCKNCYDKFPGELKKRLKKAYDEAMKSGKST
ncbi:LIM and senescent cell antigen-like-containing domain protein 2 [Bulinus truncatus]|nr:LIM and senescent cell antigen-like-containing domain protein 2 [Bulinus truncatus]